MKYFVVLLCMLYKPVYSFLCYSCDSSFNEGCQPLNSSIIHTIDCNKSSRKLNSQCIVYNYIYQDGNVVHTKRKCLHRFATTKSACDYIHRKTEQRGFRIESCYNCTTDKCNSLELQEDSKSRDKASHYWKNNQWRIFGAVVSAIGMLICFLFSSRLKRRCCCSVIAEEPNLLNSSYDVSFNKAEENDD